MTIEIKLATLLKRLPDERRKDVNNFYLVNIGGIVNKFKSSSAAHRWLKKMGYTMNEDCQTYTKTHKSEHELNNERLYKIYEF